MTIQTDCIASCKKLYTHAIRTYSDINLIRRTELVVIDLMLKLARYSKPSETGGIISIEQTWKTMLNQITSCVRAFLSNIDTKIVIACFDMDELNVAKIPTQRGRYEADQKRADSRKWRYHELIPRVAEFMLNEPDFVPEGKTLIVDLGRRAAFRTHESQSSIPVNSSLLHPTPEADNRMITWISLPIFSNLSTAVYSVDGDTFVALMLYLPDMKTDRRITWLRHLPKNPIEEWDMRAVDGITRYMYLLAQCELQDVNKKDDGIEIIDYRSLFTSLMLLRGCDFVEGFSGITFETLLKTFFLYIHRFSNFVAMAIDPQTRERKIIFSLQRFMEFIHCAHAVHHRFSVKNAHLARDKMPSIPQIRLTAARLKYALLYMANSWNPSILPPDPLERAPDPAHPEVTYSIYGLELVDPSKGPSATNIKIADAVVV